MVAQYDGFKLQFAPQGSDLLDATSWQDISQTIKFYYPKEETTMSKTVETEDLFAVYPWLDQYQTADGPSDGTEFARKLRLAAEHFRGAQALEELDIPNAILDYAANWEQDETRGGSRTVFHGDENGAKDD